MAQISYEDYKAKRPQFTAIPHAELIKLCEDAGCTAEDKAGWVKFTMPGTKARLYIPKNKEVRRIDIAEAMIADREDEIVNLGGESFGRVKQQVRFDRSKEEIVATLTSLASGLANLALQPARKREKVVALPGSAPAQAGAVEVKSEKTVSEQIEALVAKKQKLVDTATKMNVAVSEKRLASIDAKIAELQAAAVAAAGVEVVEAQ